MSRLARAPGRLAPGLLAAGLSLLPAAGAAHAQGAPAGAPPAVLAGKPAKQLFGSVKAPAPPPSRAIGFYSKGCLAGGVALPATGPTWQAMRPSRNRNWGHPQLVAFIERFARTVPKVVSWNGILVGDLAQPRGGPMLTGHASHQIGLDADIWLTPHPGRELSREERDTMSATIMVRADRLDIDPANWRPDHWKVIRLAAQDPVVERVLVNAAIKKALCREATGNRAWLAKVRPYWGHDFHMHVRLGCPDDSPNCRPQEPVPHDEGCGAALDMWFTDAVLHPKPPKEPPKPERPMMLVDLPPACTGVLLAK
ncbi:penicillin-insensitive murein endopeptidase [Xanthobacter pseudotagetidis]|uniref:penicillin-insensitive murein endopeptidase n=1 Tax=Xanthobacter pseudotagetidis TaxID=3119911 RepID=UPI00372CD491